MLMVAVLSAVGVVVEVASAVLVASAVPVAVGVSLVTEVAVSIGVAVGIAGGVPVVIGDGMAIVGVVVLPAVPVGRGVPDTGVLVPVGAATGAVGVTTASAVQ